MLAWLRSNHAALDPALHLISISRRPRRSNEWSTGKAVTFIVTLAATRCVTLAARSAGMSRKSAYALKARDPVIVEAWNTVLATASAKRTQGDRQTRAAPSISSTEWRHPHRE